MNAEKKPRAPRKIKTAADLKADLEKFRSALAALEQRAYAEELDEFVKKTNVVSDFNAIKKNVAGASDLAILAAIGKAAGIPRLVITQTEVVKRVKK